MLGKQTIDGFCVFYSETGVQGGHDWAVQDRQNMIAKIPFGHCKERGIVTQENVLGTEEFCGNQQPHQEENKTGVEDNRTGLYILKNGDYLTIYSKDRKQIVWKGQIDLCIFAPCTRLVWGKWINADQRGVDRYTWARWFLEEHPATLTLA